MTPNDKQFFDDLNEPDDGILTAAKMRRAIRKMKELDEERRAKWVNAEDYIPNLFNGYVGRYNGMSTEELPIKRDELPVCNMCRAGLHKKCERNDRLHALCVCDCERGY